MARAAAVQDLDDLPEADRLEGFAHPRETAALFGQEAAEQTLLGAFASGRMHHAWLIAGPEGVGKATLAYRFAKFLLARPEERDPFGGTLALGADVPAARYVTAQSHPGLLVLRRPYDTKSKKLRTEITVEEARRLGNFLHLTPEAGAWRVVLADTADDLNLPAANALLKSLEEPPAQTIFLLVTSQPGRLLPTIRSRCRSVEVPPLAPDALKKAVTQAIAASGEEQTKSLPAGAEWDELAHLSGGSAGRLLALHTAGGLELNRRIVTLVSALPKVDWAGVHGLGDALSGPAAESRLEMFFDLLLGFIGRLIRARSAPGDPSPDAALAGRLIAEARIPVWAEAWEAIVADKAASDALNLDRKSLILGTFARLEGAARG